MSNGNSQEGPKEAVKLVQDITKQVLTLTTGVLALSATFINTLLPHAPRFIVILFFAWGLFTFSIIGGMFTLSSIVNKLKNNKHEPFAKSTTIPAVIQWLCFILGFILLWVFVLNNLKTN